MTLGEAQDRDGMSAVPGACPYFSDELATALPAAPFRDLTCGPDVLAHIGLLPAPFAAVMTSCMIIVL